MLPFSIDPETDTLCDVVHTWANVQGDATAFFEKAEPVLDYGRLAVVMDNVREGLNGLGFGRGDRIALVHSGGSELAAVILGVMSAATVMPLAPNLAPLDFRRQVSLLGATAVIFEKGQDAALQQFAGDNGLNTLEIALKDGNVDLHQLCEGDFAPVGHSLLPATPDDTALVLRTSGTTSAGKLVPITHRQFTHRSLILGSRLSLSPRDRFLHIRPMHYANGLSAISHPLFSGGSIVFARNAGTEEVLGLLSEAGVTWFNGPPPFFQSLVSAPRGENGRGARGKLRIALVSSSRAESALLEASENLLHCPVVAACGTSESSWVAINPIEPGRAKSGTVGLPAGEVGILGLNGELLAGDARGEVVVRGPGVFSGFENDPVANEEAFIDGWFRTGDEGFLDDDGYLTLTGRVKELINRGGEKVSPAEVDAALMAQPGVQEAAVFAIPHPTLGEEVAAAVVAQPGVTLNAGALTAALLTCLAGFKLPRRFFFIDDIPKGETGKVNRRTLAEQLGATAAWDPVRGPDAGRTPTGLEARLQDIWALVLGLDRIGLNDNFFLLGGDSLRAVELFLEIEKLLQRRLPVASVFEAGTVAEMAALIEKDDAPGCMVAIHMGGAQPPFFCVHGNGGEVIGFFNLARHLAEDQPFYGIQSVGWDGTNVPFTNSDDMAAYYVSEMRKIQPHGPYYLGGYSFGGRISVYMANILRAAGEEVALLALFDPHSMVRGQYLSFGDWMARHPALRAKGRFRMMRWYWRLRISAVFNTAYDTLRRIVLFAVWEIYRSRGGRVPRFLRRPDRANRLVRLEHGEMPSYDGDAVYFKAETGYNLAARPSVYDAWYEIIKGRLEMIPVPGRHHQIIEEPYAQVLAAELTKALKSARTSSDS
jgi:acyl-CoA synthetase (AMP-forming)/AMP-acid ligase II/thioesterase domain-containing protein/acyl carrier protein